MSETQVKSCIKEEKQSFIFFIKRNIPFNLNDIFTIVVNFKRNNRDNWIPHCVSKFYQNLKLYVIHKIIIIIIVSSHVKIAIPH